MGCYNIHLQIALVMVCVENGDMGEWSAVTEGFLTIGWGDLE